MWFQESFWASLYNNIPSAIKGLSLEDVGTISEMFILTLMGFPASALPILTIIATVIDAPATVLNVVGDTASSMLVGRFTDGKKFLKREKV